MQRDLCDQLVGAFGQPRNELHAPVGIVVSKLAEQLPYPLANTRNLAGNQIAMPGNGDDQWHSTWIAARVDLLIGGQFAHVA